MRNYILWKMKKEVPDIQTVILPTDWFDNISDNQSVFVSLYDWMLRNVGVSSENKETLHHRTYVGEKLSKKLLSAEKKYLKKKLKIEGEKLDQAVNFSDVDLGPRTKIGNCSISGEVIIIIPESSKQAFEEFSSKINKKEQESAINKIKANAAGATFYQWLLSQSGRPDGVGDLAKDAAADKTFPQGSNQYEEIKSYLGETSAIEIFKKAWLEYLSEYPKRVQPYALCSECGKKLEIKDAFLVSSPESLDILDATCLSNMQFDEIVSYPLSGITYTDLEDLTEKKEGSKLHTEDLIENLKLWGVIPIVGCIYFIKSENPYAIKIGFTAGKVEKRLNSLQTAHSYKLQLLATIPGTIQYEKSLHERFASFRLKGEWFRPHPDLLNFIKANQKQQMEDD